MNKREILEGLRGDIVVVYGCKYLYKLIKESSSRYKLLAIATWEEDVINAQYAGKYLSTTSPLTSLIRPFWLQVGDFIKPEGHISPLKVRSFTLTTPTFYNVELMDKASGSLIELALENVVEFGII